MKWFFFVTFMLLNLGATANEVKRDKFQEFWHKVDSNLSRRYYNLSVDTNYIVRPMGRWRFMARYNFSGSHVDAIGEISGQEFHTHATAKCKSTISFVGSYTGITLAMTFNPGALVGWYKDYEFNTNEYYNRMGVDIIYQRAKNFRGWTKDETGIRNQIPKDMVSMRYFNFNYYYAFNHRRFSYPAAFCHSYIQKKSAGSFMLGASFQWEKLHITAAPESGDMMHRLKMANLGIGAGYGYNFAMKNNWLLLSPCTQLWTLLCRRYHDLQLYGHRSPNTAAHSQQQMAHATLCGFPLLNATSSKKFGRVNIMCYICSPTNTLLSDEIF